MSDENSEPVRNRTIRWKVNIDELAAQLAAERGYFPEKTNGGISKFLSDLVLNEQSVARLPLNEPSPGFKTQISQAQALRHSVQKGGRDKTRPSLDPKKQK